MTIKTHSTQYLNKDSYILSKLSTLDIVLCAYSVSSLICTITRSGSWIAKGTNFLQNQNAYSTVAILKVDVVNHVINIIYH